MSWVFRDEYLPARAHQIGACDDSNDFAPPHNRQPLDVMTLHQLDRLVQGEVPVVVMTLLVITSATLSP